MSSSSTSSFKVHHERTLGVAVLVCMLVLVCRTVLPPNTTGKLLERQFWIGKTFAPDAYDGVIIGDSRAYRGLDPATLERQLGGARFLNFGYSSAGVSAELLSAGVEKLDSNGRRIVILSITPFSLTGEGCANEHFLKERKRTREEILEAQYFGSVLRFFEPFDPVHLLKGTYTQALQEQLADTYYHEEYQPNGWVASWKKRWDITHALQSYRKTFERTDLDQVCTDSMLRSARELIQQGYQVYGVRPPIHEQLLEIEEAFLQGRFVPVRQKLVDAGVVWLDLPLIVHETYDGSHLTKLGAVEFTQQVAQEIAKRDPGIPSSSS